MEVFSTAFLVALVAGALRQTTPLLFTALGGMFNERSGVVNIALEGIINFGALAAAVTVQLVEAPYLAHDPNARIWWIPWLGVLAAIVVGVLVAWIHAVVSIRYRADQIVSGTAVNMLSFGLPSILLLFLYGNTSDSKDVVHRILPMDAYLPFLRDFFSTPLGRILDQSPLVYLAFLLVPLTYYLLFKTPWGLRLRSVGENPEAADSLGINVFWMRYQGVLLSGVLAGLAGAYLSISELNHFTRLMAAGRGFIALAALIFGQWHPLGILGATLLFGFAEAFRILIEGTGILPSPLIQAFPFVLTMLVLAGFIGRARPPAAIGKPYEK